MVLEDPVSSRLYFGVASSTGEESPIKAALPAPTFETAAKGPSALPLRYTLLDLQHLTILPLS